VNTIKPVIFLSIAGPVLLVGLFVWREVYNNVYHEYNNTQNVDRIKENEGEFHQMDRTGNRVIKSIDMAAVSKMLLNRPDKTAELKRMEELGRFLDKSRRYENNHDSMNVSEKKEIALEILSELPLHVLRNEILPMEAEALGKRLIPDAYSDTGTAQIQLERNSAYWNAYILNISK
jgi:hypothetical protein